MSSLRIDDVLKLFFDIRIFPLFVIGSLALSVAGNGLYSLFVDWLGDDPLAHFLILFLALLILITIAFFS